MTNQGRWKELLYNRFKDWIKDDKIIMKVIVEAGSYDEVTEKDKKGNSISKKVNYQKGEFEYEFFTIQQLVNPKYAVFEHIKKILRLYKEHCIPGISNHIDNLLFCLAAVIDCADEEEIEIWEKRFYSKFNL